MFWVDEKLKRKPMECISYTQCDNSSKFMNLKKVLYNKPVFLSASLLQLT